MASPLRVGYLLAMMEHVKRLLDNNRRWVAAMTEVRVSAMVNAQIAPS